MIALPPRRYRLGHDYRDTGAVNNPDDQFLGWINLPGSGMRNMGGIRGLKFVDLDAPVLAAIVLVTDERSAGSASIRGMTSSTFRTGKSCIGATRNSIQRRPWMLL